LDDIDVNEVIVEMSETSHLIERLMSDNLELSNKIFNENMDKPSEADSG
jgi:hypothetical protein